MSPFFENARFSLPNGENTPMADKEKELIIREIHKPHKTVYTGGAGG